MGERVILVGVLTRNESKYEKIASLEELSSLAKTAGGEFVEKFLQRRETIDPAYFIGKGKIEELAIIGKELKIDTFIFDEELSGGQIRNIEEITGKKVIDRTELVLHIFANHAHSATAKIEVELAQLKYRLSRLTGKGIALSRLGGGIGTMGPGEKKLEVDRRRIRERINFLENRLKEIEVSRSEQIKWRKNLFRVALVGYTNVGKSTLMNRLTKANVVVDDKLFSTLDATTRIFSPDGKIKILITDTIGFLRKLPHHLIASFKSTLQEAVDADLRLHIIDVSNNEFETQLSVGTQILNELGVGNKPTIYVFNKIDLSRAIIPVLKNKYPDALFISATKNENINELKFRIIKFYELKTNSIQKQEERQLNLI